MKPNHEQYQNITRMRAEGKTSSVIVSTNSNTETAPHRRHRMKRIAAWIPVIIALAIIGLGLIANFGGM